MTLRRVTLFILIFALLLGCAALPAGAEHKHTWKDLPDGAIVQPTCTEPGFKVQYCTGCGITKDVKIPALGHSFTTKTYKSYADCEHYGIFYWTCSRCGYKSEGNDRPLGHDWDEGVVTTPPSGFTPGVKTYTCRRDPSHTYTEEVDPEGWLFATLEEINDPDFTGKVKTLDLPPLVIVKQPEGGYVDENSDEGLVMYVEADGGEPPYTYEWYRTVQDNETLEQGKKIVADFYRLLGMSEEAISAELDQYTLESLSVLEGEEQEFHATQGYYGYYCVVTDSVKQTATSDIAKTKSTISIWTNPSNANLMGKDSVTLACTATGGSGEYGFSWYKVSEDDEDTWEGFGTTDDEGFNAGKHNEIEIDECGEYYCEAEDLVTHQRNSLLKVIVDEDKCRKCGKCSRKCKAACIDFKNGTIDYSRCVVCGDCLELCEFDALHYCAKKKNSSKKKASPESAGSEEQPYNPSRRSFLVGAALATAAATIGQEKKKVDGGLAAIEDKVAPHRTTSVTPPGSLSAKNMTTHCTACQLCVVQCPNEVLRPSTDLKHFMKPIMSYERGYCRPECNRCSEVCPAGAIHPITLAEKSSTQIGHAVWIKQNCIPVTDGVECGNCERHCPTGAIEMVPLDPDDELGAWVPAVDESRCIGCGACENLCPARPLSAIYVEGHEVHKEI